MNYSQGFYNMKDYMNPNNMPPYYGNIPMPVMGMACMDNTGYPSSMPFIPDSYIPTKSNMSMPNGDMPALPSMPTNNMPNMNMPTYPDMPGMPGTMPGMPGTMPGMPNNNRTYPMKPRMPENNMPTYPTMPGMPEGNMPNYPMPGTQMNCKQLYEYMKRMNCMEQLNDMNDMQIDEN
ncbi:hypothetical protein J2Z76_000836 [Sedimentibacter acidaminivorans]|uniref:Uncharacterized protein n=1 Tax=Sedimentibacter acidaminivorans TaxID=913099 RepID=A0ABS4GBB3_9FIRM|nr:hypothetical protein [Sedimentibacter acidaminivorans]MBP1924979.1 hypothetical protein [Sedimentibacter acidaminivorans]